MFLGLPLRTMKATTELVIMPLCSSAFQSLATRPASTSLVMSGSRARVTTSAARPFWTARLWSPEAPYDWENPTPLPASVFWNSGISCS
jgi:hypothetical protein